jgi:hypothetical protein
MVAPNTYTTTTRPLGGNREVACPGHHSRCLGHKHSFCPQSSGERCGDECNASLGRAAPIPQSTSPATLLRRRQRMWQRAWHPKRATCLPCRDGKVHAIANHARDRAFKPGNPSRGQLTRMSGLGQHVYEVLAPEGGGRDPACSGASTT